MSQPLAPLAPLQTADLPERKAGFWKIAGPGAVLVGLSIGAGEIVVWPRIVAEYGASMVWGAVVGVFLQMWVNFEIGRWTIATGESVYTGYSRVWRGFALLFVAFNIFGWIAPGWGRTSGLALKALLVGPAGFGSDAFWTAVTFAGVALLLFGPKVIYRSVEKTIELLVLIVTVGLILVAVAVGTAATWGELARGILNVPYINPNMSVKAFFIALVFAGAGGTANLFYTFYLRDKKIGMGARVPELLNPLRGAVEKVPSTGFVFEPTAENQRRFLGWFDYVKKDQLLFFWGLNSLTILLFIFGSLAVLHPKKIVPGSGTLIWDEAQILGTIWGEAGRVIFLLVGVATLFSTQLALVDGVSRSLSDLLYVHFPAAQKRSLSWWYLLIAGAWIVAGCVITAVLGPRVDELGFLFNAAYVGGFAMAVYVPLTLYLNLRFLPPTARPGRVCTAFMLLASLVYGGFAVACVHWEIQSSRAPRPPGLDAIKLGSTTPPAGWQLVSEKPLTATDLPLRGAENGRSFQAGLRQDWNLGNHALTAIYLTFNSPDARAQAQEELMGTGRPDVTVVTKGDVLVRLTSSDPAARQAAVAALDLSGIEALKLRPDTLPPGVHLQAERVFRLVDLADQAEEYGTKIVAGLEQTLTVEGRAIRIEYVQAASPAGLSRIRQAQRQATLAPVAHLERETVALTLRGGDQATRERVQAWLE